MLVTYDLVRRCSLRRQQLLQPMQARRNLRVLITQTLKQLDGKRGREAPTFCVAAQQSVGLESGTVDTQESICQDIRLLACGATTYDARGGAAQVFHQHYPQRDSDRPQLADGERLNALIGAHETTQRLGIEAAIGVGNKRPSHPEHARIPLQGPAVQLGQASIEARRQILPDLADLLLNQVVVIE